AHALAESLKSRQLPLALHDVKCQVSVEYRDGKAQRAKAVVVTSQHRAEVSHVTLKEAIIEEVVKKVVPPEFLDKQTVYYINPTGKFVVGGPQGDCGLTGPKIILHTYGGLTPAGRCGRR